MNCWPGSTVWSGERRNYDHTEWESGDVPNRCLCSATACLYGICEAAILAAGYAPAVGFIHTGKPQSFVYDIADIFKFETVVPVAFRIAAKNPQQSGTGGAACLPGCLPPDASSSTGSSRRSKKVLVGRWAGRARSARGVGGAGNSEQGGAGRCWSSWLRMRRRGCADGWRSGCLRCGPESMWAKVSRRVREMIWDQVRERDRGRQCGDGLEHQHRIGFRFQDHAGRTGGSRSKSTGSKLVSFLAPDPAAGDEKGLSLVGLR